MSVNKFKVGDVVKCVNSGVLKNLTTGKDYVLLDVTDGGIKVENDKGSCFYYYSYRFELSKGGSANAQQTCKSPKFKEGDMVYLIGFDCLKPHKLISTGADNFTMKFRVIIDDDNSKTFTENGHYTNADITPRIVLATEENRQVLNKLLGVEYEPLKLTGSDLAKKLLKTHQQICRVSDISDDYASSNNCFDLIAKFECGSFITMSGMRWGHAVPCDQHGTVLMDE